MLRIVRLAILPGMLLTTCATWVFADTVRPANRVAIENKQMYSNRPVGFTVQVPYYGTPMAPRFIAPPTMAQSRTVATVPGVHQTGVPVVVTAPVPTQMLPTTVPQFGVPQVVEKTVILREPQPEVNVNDELDTFYARLAKIRLEQRQLPEALALIQRIKSETFRVRTVVSLAEYVSRDKTYQTEAAHLYRLALAGMEALDQGQPFRIDADGGNVAPLPINQSPPVQSAPAPQDPPVVVTPRPAPVPEPLPNVVPSVPDTRPQPIPVTDPPEPPPVAPPPELSPGDPPPFRPPLILEGDTGRNGRFPPPPPPRGNGVDGGIVVSPPERPPIAPEPAPPARTTEEDNGLIPPPPTRPAPVPLENEVPSPDSSATAPTSEPSPYVRPTPAIPLTDVEPEPPIIVPRRIQEEEPQSPRPPIRRPPRIILDEN